MRIAKISVKKPVATFMVYISLLILGAIAIYRIPLAFLPTLDWPEMWVWIPYPNSSPTYIEKNIVKPAEEMLSTISGLKKIRATADADSAQFQITFDWGKKLDMVRMQVDEKLDIAKREMPDDVEHIYVFNFNTTDIPVVQARISATGVDLSKNYDLLDKRIANKIRRIPGVAKVELNGVQAREINIYLILDKIKEHGIDVGGLVRRLQGANTQMSLGKISEDGFHFNVRVLGNFETIELIEDFKVNDRGLRLKDIATITYEEPALTFGRHLNRQGAVALEVFKESSANTVEVARNVLDAINSDIGRDPLLKGIELFIWNDQAAEIINSVNGLRNAGLVGGILAVFVLYFFLRRWDATFIVSLAIPLSLVTASVVLFIMGKNFNILSMMGLMLGVGMLVDNAIVVLESIYRRYQKTGDPISSSIMGTKEVGMAVACATMTTLIVFLPLIIGGRDELSVWLKEVGISISITLICSLFVSLTLIPLMASRILMRKTGKESKFISFLQDRYVSAISWTMRHRIAMFLVIIGTLVLGVLPFAMGWVSAKPFSGGIKYNRLGIRYEFFDYFYKSQAEDYVNRMEDYLFKNAKEFHIKTVYSMFSDNDAQSIITFDRSDLTDDDIQKLRKKIREEHPVLPGAKIGFWGEEDDRESPVQRVSVNLYGERTEFLSTMADEAIRRMSQLEGLEDVRSSILSGKNEVKVSLNKELAAKYGLSPEELSRIFYFTMGGQKLRKFNAGDREVDVYISLDKSDREDIEDLKKLVVVGTERRGVPLGDLAEFSIVPRAERIVREDKKTTVTVSATYEGKNFKKAQAELKRIFDSMDFPPGYSWSFGERMRQEQEQTRQMIVNLLLALALIYIVMASLFESLSHPFSIVFSIPFALPGISWLLLATQTPFNIMAQIGLLILMGIVVNNGIVLIDKVNQLRRDGFPRDEAIVVAGRERLRPILMTALTTILGILPMSLGSSSVGDAYYYPMARTVMGGLAASTLLTLLILPYIYTIFDEIAAWAKKVVVLSQRSRIFPPKNLQLKLGIQTKI
ncbi:MAG: efflux RND transporter permease subunit [Acidobacteriota bacterium]